MKLPRAGLRMNPPAVPEAGKNLESGRGLLRRSGTVVPLPPVYHCTTSRIAPPNRSRNRNVTFVGGVLTIRSFEYGTRVELQRRIR